MKNTNRFVRLDHKRHLSLRDCLGAVLDSKKLTIRDFSISTMFVSMAVTWICSQGRHNHEYL